MTWSLLENPVVLGLAPFCFRLNEPWTAWLCGSSHQRQPAPSAPIFARDDPPARFPHVAFLH